MLFQATFRDKRGSIRASAFGDTPEAAASTIFASYPTCQTVTVCNAYLDDTGRPRGNGSNIHWLSRREVAK